MKELFLASTLISILFLSACGDSDEITEQIEDETEQAIEKNNLAKENQQTEKDELTDDKTESSAEKLKKSINSENNPSDDQITILENKYDSMTHKTMSIQKLLFT